MDLSDRLSFGTGSIGRRLKGQSYLVKMALGVLVLVLVVAAMGYFITAQTGGLIADQTEEELKRTSDLQSSQLETWLQSMRRQTSLLTQADQVVEGDREAVGSYFEDQRRNLPNYVAAVHYVEFSDGGATVLTSTLDSREGQTLEPGSVPWADAGSQIGQDSSYISGLYPTPAPTSSSQAMAFVEPVEGTDGRAVVLVTDLAKASLNFKAPNKGRTFVANREGTIVLSTDPRTIGDNAFDSGLLTRDTARSAVAGGSMFTKTIYTDQLRVEGSRQVTGLTGLSRGGNVWLVASQAPASTAFQVRNEVRNLLLLLIGGVILVGGLVVGGLGYTTVRDLRTLSEKAGEVEQGNFDVSLETGRTDEIGDAYDSVDGMRATLREKIRSAREAEQRQRQFNDQLTAQVDEYSAVMERAAGGDLTVRLDEDTEIDQLSDLAADVNETMDAIEQSVEEAKEFSRRVANESRETNAAIGEIQSASQSVASSMQQVNDEVSSQHQQLQETVREMNQLSSTTEEIASSLTEVARIAEQTAETGQQGQVAAENAIEDIVTVESKADDAVSEIEALVTQMEQIEEITEFIGEIAHETNMLALNANIEASRAGGEGQEEAAESGFAVVADQIKDLAAEAKESAEEIEQLIQQTQDQTQSAADRVRDTSDVLTDSVDTVEETVDALEQIATYANETNDGVQDMNDATQQQAKSAEEAVSMVEESAQISERTTEEAENVAAAAEEQTSAIDQINDSVEDLATQANELNTLLGSFTVGEGAAASPGDHAAVDD